jgi:hypothetical protein
VGDGWVSRGSLIFEKGNACEWVSHLKDTALLEVEYIIGVYIIKNGGPD